MRYDLGVVRRGRWKREVGRESEQEYVEIEERKIHDKGDNRNVKGNTGYGRRR